MAATHQGAAAVYLAPQRPPANSSRPYIFLAGTTTQATRTPGDDDWRQRLIATTLRRHPVTVLNPHRADWDATWREDYADARWAEQVEWELDMQERADLVVVYLGPATDAPVSLLELGLAAGGGKRVVVCADGAYRKRGNVEAVCRRYDDGLVVLVATEGELGVAVEAAVEEMMRMVT
ncbi:hypothetical protein PCL_02728 [Purpureocillium lilacinum]|uniref:Nucleoside 2-deoxyribosyltransferase domain-containing protein n=1 Tax=Purpureocillium lilacinum TaxID=33203 RepID=A0A2U3DZZ3_PURLI|nr:hypothetical protein PCL_02728 [Purpureocillium lilacinum]